MMKQSSCHFRVFPDQLDLKVSEVGQVNLARKVFPGALVDGAMQAKQGRLANQGLQDPLVRLETRVQLVP